MKNLYCIVFLLFAVVPVHPQGSKKTAPAVSQEAKPVSRSIEYRANDLVSISTRMRYVTVLIFPETEEIAEVTSGDRDYWIIDAAKNLVHVKPAKEGAKSNINVITKSANVYSFVLSEGGASVDLRVNVELKDPAMRVKAGMDRAAEEAQRERETQAMAAEMAAAKAEAKAAQVTADELRKNLAEYPQRLRFPYEYRIDRAPFYIQAIYHDTKFTYIKARPAREIAVYETVDGKPSLVDVDFVNGTFVVRKVLARGYVQSGSQTSGFARRTE